ncbi:amidase family protein [Halomonas sp. HG01]|uniref:amidase family protein n=1 Tax=Halomonas sp. HG01 TaxID=1609967 RepID=UPI0006146384|nr:amidase family protein [Halomonas sp. HG01]
MSQAEEGSGRPGGEQPALSLNAGFSRDGMPLGVQLIGPRLADHFVLKLAKVLETRLALAPSWPSPPVAQ